MRRNDNRRTRSSRGALVTIGALFLASGVIRLADGTGAAIAREVEAFSNSASAEPAVPSEAQAGAECVTEEGINQMTAQLRERWANLDEREEKIALRMKELKEIERALRSNLEKVKAAFAALAGR